MSKTPVFDEVTEAYKACKKGWQREAILSLIVELEKSIATDKCTKKKCESKCNSVELGKLKAISIAREFGGLV